MKKTSKRGALVKKAHAIIREIVLERDGECVCPPPVNGHSAVRQAGHVIPSTSGGCRFSLWNIFCQCASCNMRHVRQWHIYQEWFEKTFGSERWLALQEEKKNDGLKAYEIEEIIVQLKLILKRQMRWKEVGAEFKPYYTQNEILSGAWSELMIKSISFAIVPEGKE